VAASVKKVGVTDSGAGAGVAEYLGLQGPFAALSEVMTVLPHGDPWELKASLSYTPPVVTDTLPPCPVMAWKVPSGKALLFTGGCLRHIVADETYVRVCRRYFLFGYQATAAPAAPAAPTVALQNTTDGIGTTGTYDYKVAAIDSFRREGPASTHSANVALSSTQRTVSITPPALPTGGIGYNIYRCLANQQDVGPWYYVGTTFGITAYIDAQPDADVDTALTPLNNWATGAIAGEVMDGPGEVIIEVGAVALTGAPTHLVYKGTYNQYKQAFPVTFPTTVGQRIRGKLFGETANFVTTPMASANLWRGPHTADVRTRHEKDFGTTAVTGINAAPSAGAFVVWGQQTLGYSERPEPAAAAVAVYGIRPTNPHGSLIPELGEIVVEIGNIAAAAAGVRDIQVSGLLVPTTGT
jgi:hypothetical protein